MPTAIVKDNIRLFDYNVPMAGYRDTIWRGEVAYYLTEKHAVIGMRHIPLANFKQFIERGLITISEETKPESEETMSNLPAVKQDNVEISLTPQEQINKASDKARLLKEVVDKAGLSRKLGGKKEHLEFEAWQAIARWHHCTPSTEWTRPIKEGDKIVGWEARVNVLDADGKVIGSSEGMCMADEQNWKGKPSYALRSMAQTRTAGKALRSLFAHIAVLAGYSPTPAEEMDGVVLDEDRRPKSSTPHPPVQNKKTEAQLQDNGEQAPSDAASPAQKKKLFAMAMEKCDGDREEALAFIRWALNKTGKEYWSKSLISGFFDTFEAQAEAYIEEMDNG